ncbi:RNA polymerase sigma factor SigJ [Streptomyces broussonetiae]|uniref:Sigma-70 family RNA polymerase sigma factor n=1 Tax=Streptomyces broussonetiae TaxID=2686304 RepID=A0A6I6NEW2_9ACTN|nr:RNA polymerase sigma factor SigJ [Streptomyces broussonetiae]QHA08650.1 sigma-70 family RNA polymerase sigma factor [Streptomyces broussonetiae]
MTEHRTPAGTAAATQAFLDHRELLFAVAYNMLGSVADAEDVLQETWLAWAGRTGAEGAGQPPEIRRPRAYLVRITVRQALARRARIARRRETYTGPWLPEPLLTDGPDGPAAGADAAERALRTESVSLALLVVLETLTPLERAVFVLHEVFGYAHTEIADVLGRSPAAVRQLAHRARARVRARRPRYEARPRVRRQATQRFVAAALGGDLAALLEILAPQVTLWTDGGGKAQAALRPVRGRDKVARALTGYATRSAAGLRFEHRDVNGDAAVVVFEDGAPHAVMVMDLDPDGERVREVYLVTNPDKLPAVAPDGTRPQV